MKNTTTNLNVLNDLHPRLNNMAIIARDRICAACNWSIPTYYRKARTVDSTYPQMSNAESEKILSIIYDLLIEQAEHVRSLQTGRS
jgi:hypothetical protein